MELFVLPSRSRRYRHPRALANALHADKRAHAGSMAKGKRAVVEIEFGSGFSEQSHGTEGQGDEEGDSREQ